MFKSPFLNTIPPVHPCVMPEPSGSCQKARYRGILVVANDLPNAFITTTHFQHVTTPLIVAFKTEALFRNHGYHSLLLPPGISGIYNKGEQQLYRNCSVCKEQYHREIVSLGCLSALITKMISVGLDEQSGFPCYDS